MERHGLRDDQFARIENLLPGLSWHARTQQRCRQLAFRRSGDLEIPHWRAMARFAGTFRWLVQQPPAFLALGCQRRLGESFQRLGR